MSKQFSPGDLVSVTMASSLAGRLLVDVDDGYIGANFGPPVHRSSIGIVLARAVDPTHDRRPPVAYMTDYVFVMVGGDLGWIYDNILVRAT